VTVNFVKIDLHCFNERRIRW